jgi:ribosomal protein S18 acetylase RimI-like enzyme
VTGDDVARDDLSECEIRPLRPEDADQLGDLFVELAHDPASAHFHPFPLDRAQAGRIAMRDGIREDRYFVARVDERIVGFGMLRGWDEGYVVPSFGVAVAIAHRGRGIGRRLLRHAIAVAREAGAERMILKVHTENVGARYVYESEGFTFDEPPAADGQVRGTLILRDPAGP